MKVIARGFVVGRTTYLHSPWNVLDFVVVVAGWLPYLPGINSSGNVSAIRTVRVLRPLRTLAAIGELKVTEAMAWSAARRHPSTPARDWCAIPRDVALACSTPLLHSSRQVLIDAMLASVRQLGNVLILFGFAISMFSILGALECTLSPSCR